uniref:Endonuclease n=1 Tax=Sinocyclocheilus rhinocerous TaxID=307959 RepID=A0A673H529_9TELE
MYGNDSESKQTDGASKRYPFRSPSKPKESCTYMRIPFSLMSGNESESKEENDRVSSPYKLINGFPSGCTDLRTRKSYVQSYNNETKNAEWVYEILNKSIITESNQTAENDQISSKYMNFGETLSNKDYDQGHLAAAANHRWSQEAYHDTYLMGNIVPQPQALNRGPWKRFEKECRDTAVKANVRNVHVNSGPLYLREEENDEYVRVTDTSEMTWLDGKAVPTHFFKVITVENNDGTVEEPDFFVMPELCIDEEDGHLRKDIGDNIELSGLQFLERCKGLTTHVFYFRRDQPCIGVV